MQNVHELLTATEVQELLDVDRSTIYRMATDGRLPAVKIGRQWRFPAQQIQGLVGFGEQPDPGRHAAIAEKVIGMASEALGVMMVVADLDGHPITPVVNACPRFLALDGDPAAVERCAEEWKSMALDPDPRPRFSPGAFGFLCARSIVRTGGNPVAMVLAGGVAPDEDDSDDLFVLSDEQRRRVIAALPRVASVLAALHQDPRSTA
jgi:excisionase family DNA binding protein